MENKIIIIAGDLASGKTTLAKCLSTRCGIDLIYKDILKEHFSDLYGFSNREENLKLSKMAMDLLFTKLEQYLKEGKKIIVESNFHRHELEKITHLAKEYNYQTVTFVLVGDPKILYDRYLNRAINQNRHPTHLSGISNYQQFYDYIISSRNEVLYVNPFYIVCDDFSFLDEENINNIMTIIG